MTWDDLPRRASGWTVKRTLWWAFGLFVVAAIVLPIGNLAFGWFNSTLQVVSPQNVREQYSTAYGDWEGMKQAATVVCNFRPVVNAETDPGLKSQRIGELAAYGQNYARIAQDYNAAYDNAFRAKHVGPGDIPKVAPSLDDMMDIAIPGGCTTPDPLESK
jgi:hypothetical protein